MVTPLGFRTPFVTNSAGINSGNSNLLVHRVSDYGLNNKCGGTNTQFYSASGDPMIVTGLKILTDDGCDVDALWGSTITLDNRQ